MAEKDPLLLWLKKIALFLAIIALCLSCAVIGLVLSMLMDLRRDVKTLRGQAAQAVTDLEHLQTSVFRLLDLDALVPVLEQGVEQLPVPSPGASGGNSVAEQEIAYLLDCIGGPELQYEYEGKRRPSSWVRVKLHGKAVILDSEIASAEDFINKVAAHTSEGATYYLIDKAGEKVELKAWLLDRLQERRAAEPTENR